MHVERQRQKWIGGAPAVSHVWVFYLRFRSPQQVLWAVVSSMNWYSSVYMSFPLLLLLGGGETGGGGAVSIPRCFSRCATGSLMVEFVIVSHCTNRDMIVCDVLVGQSSLASGLRQRLAVLSHWICLQWVVIPASCDGVSIHTQN